MKRDRRQNDFVCRSLHLLLRNIWKCAQADYVITFLQNMWIVACQEVGLLILAIAQSRARITLLRGSADGASSGGHADGQPLAGQQCSSMWALCCAHLATCLLSTQGKPGSPAGTTSPSSFQPEAVLESAYSAEWPALRRNTFTSSSLSWTMCSEKGKVFLSAKINLRCITPL